MKYFYSTQHNGALFVIENGRWQSNSNNNNFNKSKLIISIYTVILSALMS